MQLRKLEAFEINKVLDQNFDFWSPGLSRERYRHYQWWQLRNAWGRRRLSYYGLFSPQDLLVASCKLYSLDYVARAQSYKIAGVGAVFVPESLRGHAYGIRLLEQIADYARAEGFAAILLNSDIEPEYYARLGYVAFDARTFSVQLNAQWLKWATEHVEKMADPELDETFSIRPVEAADIREMCRHHARWLSKQAYGLRRNDDYWRFKIMRERYLFEHSALNWPQQTFVADNYGEHAGGYAIVEQSGPYLRVLEVIGEERIAYSLWSQIFRLAARRNARVLRSWASMAPPLPGQLLFTERDWSIPMILPLRDELSLIFKGWAKANPPPLLELDHF